MSNILKELEPWRELIEEITPFGETPEQVLADKTKVQINAPRALIAQAFQANISLLYKLKNKGLLKTPESKNGSNEIPNNLSQAITFLKHFVNKEEQEKIKSGKLNINPLWHHSIGRWIRNNWGLWTGSPLQDFFHDLGIRHADDMSGIILKSFQKELRGEDIELHEQVQYYRTYWKNKGIDPDKIGTEEEE